MAHLFKKFRKKPKSKANDNSTKFYNTVSNVNDNFSVSQNDSCAKTVSESIRSESSHASNVSRTSDDSNELTVYWKQPRYERTTKNPIFINEPVDFYEDYHHVTLERRRRLRNIGSFPNGNITRESIANLPRAFSMGNLYPWNNNSGNNGEAEKDENKVYIELQNKFQKYKSESDISTSLNGINKKLSKTRKQSLPDLFSGIDQPTSLTQSPTFPSYSSYSSLPSYSKNADSGVFQSTDDDIESIIHEDVENLLQSSNAQSGSRITKRRSDGTFSNSISRFDGSGADSLPVDEDDVINDDDIDYSASVDAVLKDLENSLELSDDDISINNDDVRVSRESLSYWASSESIISDDDSKIKASGAWYQKRGKRKSEGHIDFSSNNNFIDDIDDILDPSVLQPPRRSFSTPVETRKRTSNVSFLSLGIKHQKLKSDEIFFHVEQKISDVQSKLNEALESQPNDSFQDEFTAKHKKDIEMKQFKLAEAVATQNIQSITDTLSENKTDDYSSDNNLDNNNNIVKKKRKHVNILKTVNTKPKELNIASKPYAVKVMLEPVQNVQLANKSKNKRNHSELFRSRLDQFEQKTSTSSNSISDKPTVRNKQSFQRTSKGSYVLSAAHVNLKSGFSDTDKQSDAIFKSREDLELKASDSKPNVQSLVNDIESELNVDAETIEKEKLARKISKKMNVSLPRGASTNLPIISTTNEESSLDEDYVDSYLSLQSNVNTRTPTGLTILRRESTIFRRPKKTIEDILMEGADVSYICDRSL